MSTEEAAATTEVNVVAATRKAKDELAATTFSAIGRGHIRAAATHPFGRGNGLAAAACIPIGHGHIPVATTSINFPVASTRVHTGCGSAVASAWPMRPQSMADKATPPDKDTQGGFMRYFAKQPHNFHLVGAPAHSSHVHISIPETNGGSSPSEVELLSEQQPENKKVRTEKRIMWTPKEDERLMSAWIENSTDSATGADRKGEAYWGDVIKAYNNNTPSQRKRNAKQAKD
ncbi:hypothetical protein E2562_025382 [Oryza meyeriana var. granulata]|uniref:Myb-like domain-containing protein n=1 Tax=Oryza meyeriana var. granulata TaxID=110450 RepID=A0A6G1DNK6_9ORYZ|nr:hypothetical protein E2562_025382 [Oryza meyeriana var. granulata]